MRTLRWSLALCCLLADGVTGACLAQAAEAGGAHDFDWEVGAWDTHVRVRAPLAPTAAWSEYAGTSIVHAFAGGRSNLVDLAIAGSGKSIEGVALRLFNPATQQWSLNYASMRDGALTAPVFGSFVDGRGVFYGQDAVDGRVVLVRFVISRIDADSARFEQSYSADGGQHWVPNWIATDVRRPR